MIKNLVALVSVGVGIIVLIIALTFMSLWFTGYFAPKFEDVNRKVFEQTKSYTHGAIQDLGKYYDEYHRISVDDTVTKEGIKTVVRMRFAELDASKINPTPLREFLIEMRGY